MAQFPDNFKKYVNKIYKLYLTFNFTKFIGTNKLPGRGRYSINLSLCHIHNCWTLLNDVKNISCKADNTAAKL